MSGDIAISVSNRVPVGSPITTKPSYLVSLEETIGKTKTIRYFITLDGQRWATRGPPSLNCTPLSAVGAQIASISFR